MLSRRKAGAVFASTASWPRMKRAVAALSDSDLAEANRLERLGKRRTNLLMVLKAERQVRQGQEQKMLHLKSEARI